MSKPVFPLADRFPADFLFGAATASYQIEGAAEEDGRKPSIWDAFSHTPHRVENDDTGDIACDHYHRWQEDLDLAASLNLDAYRFSIAWPRVLPDGEGAINPAGLDFYDKLVDGILERGMKPFATLYHWDLPLTLHGFGGWTTRRTAYAFADYARVVMERLGDRLASVATLNEPWCSAILGYLWGIHAPGEKHIDATLAAIHTLNLAHGLAVDACRSVAPKVPMGIVLNLKSVYPYSDSSYDVEAARRHVEFHDDMFCGPIFGGHYPERAMKVLGSRFPKIEAGDLEIISRPLDFLGINYYAPERIADAPDGAYPSSWSRGPRAGSEVSEMGWEVHAPGLAHVIEELKQRWTIPPIYITENGMACKDATFADGRIDDQDRLSYLDAHLSVVADLIEAGHDIRGYFAWSLLDNYEWSHGYAKRFGLVHVDYTSQKRTPKASALWYGDVLKAHRRKNTPA